MNEGRRFKDLRRNTNVMVERRVELLRQEGIRVSFLDLDPHLLHRALYQPDMIHLNHKGVEALGSCILGEIGRLARLRGEGRVPPPARRR